MALNQAQTLEDYDKVSAYVLQKEFMSSGRYYLDDFNINMQIPKDTVIVWKYVTDPEKIINAPINDVIFVNPNDSKDHSEVLDTILSRISLDPLIARHPKLFCCVVKRDPHDKFAVNPDPTLAVTVYNLSAMADEFAAYLKDIDGPFDYSDWNNNISVYHKDRINEAHIYIQPIKKLLSYNPVLAKRQYDIRKAAAKRKMKPPAVQKKESLRRWHLEQFHHRLRNLFYFNLNLRITYNHSYRSYRSYRTKYWYAEQMLVSIDYFNLMYKKHEYRNLVSFKRIAKAWRNTTEEEKKAYPILFVKWMDKESKIRPRPKKDETNDWNASFKPANLNMFKLSQIKWRI